MTIRLRVPTLFPYEPRGFRWLEGEYHTQLGFLSADHFEVLMRDPTPNRDTLSVRVLADPARATYGALHPPGVLWLFDALGRLVGEPRFTGSVPLSLKSWWRKMARVTRHLRVLDEQDP